MHLPPECRQRAFPESPRSDRSLSHVTVTTLTQLTPSLVASVAKRMSRAARACLSGWCGPSLLPTTSGTRAGRGGAGRVRRCRSRLGDTIITQLSEVFLEAQQRRSTVVDSPWCWGEGGKGGGEGGWEGEGGRGVKGEGGLSGRWKPKSQSVRRGGELFGEGPRWGGLLGRGAGRGVWG